MLRRSMIALVIGLATGGPAFAQAPVQTGPPNVPAFKPAFPGQTRAPAIPTEVSLDVQTIASGLSYPWGLAFLPDGRMLVTEKSPPSLRIVDRAGHVSDPVAGLPQAFGRDQGGLLDVAVAPDFPKTGLIYWSYAERRADGTGTAVARGHLVNGPKPRVENVQAVFREMPSVDSTKHYGGRLVFAPDGKLFITLGERSVLEGRRQAQDLGSDLGKIVRVNPDGSVPADNPFVGRAGARPEIWSYGHRNVEAAALDKEGRLWEVEMGPRGGDELNLVEKGRDYGWPTITYGEEYSGEPVGKGITQAEGMEQPVYYWDPVISPSGMTIYTGDLFPEWRNNVFIGGLSSRALVRLVLSGDRVVGEERLLTNLGSRIRDVVQGPDGALYLLTDASDGRVLRVSPKR